MKVSRLKTLFFLYVLFSLYYPLVSLLRLQTNIRIICGILLAFIGIVWLVYLFFIRIPYYTKVLNILRILWTFSLFLALLRSSFSLESISRFLLLTNGVGMSYFTAFVLNDRDRSQLLKSISLFGLVVALLTLTFFSLDILIKHCHECRLGRPYAHPNLTASILVPTFFIFFHHYRDSALKQKRIFVNLASLSFLLAIILTKSRASILGLVLSILVYYSMTQKDRRIAKIGFAILALLIIGFLAYPKFFRMDPYTFFFSLDYRLILWKKCLHHIARHPLWGMGIGAFENIRSTILQLPYPPHHAHNEYIQILLEGGIFAFFIFATLLVVPLLNWKKTIEKETYKGVMVGYLYFIFIFLFSTRLIYLESTVLFFLLHGILMSGINFRAR